MPPIVWWGWGSVVPAPDLTLYDGNDVSAPLLGQYSQAEGYGLVVDSTSGTPGRVAAAAVHVGVL